MPRDPLFNQQLLSRLLAERAEVLETPVRFYAMSPAQVRRTTVAQGLTALARIVVWRLRYRSAEPSVSGRGTFPI